LPPDGIPPGGPIDLTPNEANIIRRFLEHVRRAIEQLRQYGADSRLIQYLEKLLEQALRELAQRSPGLWRTLQRLISALLWAFEAMGFRRGLAWLVNAIGVLFRVFGNKFFWFGSVFAYAMFAWQVGSAVGEVMAKVKVNDKETVGTWWGNRFWELLKGPCPDLLNAYNQAIREWRLKQMSGASAQEQAAALARVILVLTEYIRRCLTVGSAERAREERYLEILEKEYRDLVTPPPATPPAPSPGPPAAPTLGEICKVKVTLVSVAYTGSNIGKDWKIMVSAGTSSQAVPVSDLAHGATRSLIPPLTVYESGFSPCSSFGLVPLSVEARQKRWFGDDVGTNSKLLRPTCPTERDEQMAVWVAHESTFWGSSELALLTFTFHISAACSAAAVP
jgi:hypothetical protein